MGHVEIGRRPKQVSHPGSRGKPGVVVENTSHATMAHGSGLVWPGLLKALGGPQSISVGPDADIVRHA